MGKSFILFWKQLSSLSFFATNITLPLTDVELELLEKLIGNDYSNEDNNDNQLDIDIPQF